MENSGEYTQEELWILLKRRAIKCTKLANESNVFNGPICIKKQDRCILQLDEKGCEIEKFFIKKLPKTGINLTDNQKIDLVNQVLSKISIKDISYQSLLAELRNQTANVITYLFGLTNLKLNIEKTFKIDDQIQIGNSRYVQDDSIFNDSVLQSDFFKEENNYILVSVNGPDDKETARKAENQANIFINVLNGLYCNRSEPISIMTEIEKNTESSVFFYLKKYKNGNWRESYNTRPDKILPYMVLNVSELKIVRKLYENRGKDNKYSKLIFTLNWLGKSMKETDYGSAFLEVIIGLECIAEKQYNGMVSPSINFQISYFVAIILGENKEDRKLIIKEMKKLYMKRSQIVHDGKSSITYENYKNIFHLIKKLIYTIIYDKTLKNIEDLNSWVDEQLLS